MVVEDKRRGVCHRRVGARVAWRGTDGGGEQGALEDGARRPRVTLCSSTSGRNATPLQREPSSLVPPYAIYCRCLIIADIEHQKYFAAGLRAARHWRGEFAKATSETA